MPPLAPSLLELTKGLQFLHTSASSLPQGTYYSTYTHTQPSLCVNTFAENSTDKASYYDRAFCSAAPRLWNAPPEKTTEMFLNLVLKCIYLFELLGQNKL